MYSFFIITTLCTSQLLTQLYHRITLPLTLVLGALHLLSNYITLTLNLLYLETNEIQSLIGLL